MTTKTKEDIEQLKQSWMKDPCWDIEDTEGFEEYYEELKAWREERDRQIEKRIAEQAEKRIEAVMNATGLGKADRQTLLSLYTFSEIENDVARQERFLGNVSTSFENISLELMKAQIRATLLQAAQLKRIADALEEIADQDDGTPLINSAKIWGSEQ